MEASSQKTIADQINIQKVETKPFSGQKPGTSGLRKKVIISFEHSFMNSSFSQDKQRKLLFFFK